MRLREIILDDDGDAGEFWIARVLTYRNTDTRFVFCLGGSFVFVSALLKAGYQIIVMDRDVSVLSKMKQQLKEAGFDCNAASLNFLCADVERGIGALPCPADVMLVIRCAHHMNDITRAFRMFANYVHGNMYMVILDTTRELLEQQISDRQLFVENYKGSQHETHDYLCLQGCVASGLYDEASVKALLGKNGLADMSDFYYPIPCPCGNWGCGSIMSYWLGVWDTDEVTIRLNGK